MSNHLPAHSNNHYNSGSGNVRSSTSVTSVGSVVRPSNAFTGIFTTNAAASSVAAPPRRPASSVAAPPRRPASSVAAPPRRRTPAAPPPLSQSQSQTQQSQSQSQTQQSQSQAREIPRAVAPPPPRTIPGAAASASAPAPSVPHVALIAGATGANGRRYANLNEFLNAHVSQDKNKGDKDKLTHSECHGPKRRLIVPPTETDTLNELFLKEVVLGVGASKRRAVSHLVEYPFTRNDPAAPGVLAVDIDIKIDSTVYRAHARRNGWEELPAATTDDGVTYMAHMVCSKRHILPFVQAQMAELYRLLDYQDRDTVRVFVLQKKKAKAATDVLFSDGIHMFLSAALTMQQHNWMYDRMTKWIEQHWMNPLSPHYLPGLTTDAKQILDKNVYAGNTSVLKYGARKAGDTLVYAMTALYEFQADIIDDGDAANAADMVPAAAAGGEVDWLERVLPHTLVDVEAGTAADDDNEEPALQRRRRSNSLSTRGGGGAFSFGPWRQSGEIVSNNTLLHTLEKRWFHLLSVRAVSADVLVRPVRAALAEAFQAFVDRDGRRFVRRDATVDELRAIGGTDVHAIHRAQLADFTPEALLDVQTTDDVVRFMEIFRASINPGDEATSLMLSYLFNLPESYYAKGHYGERLKVGFALHSYSPKMIVAYLAFCAQREDFDFRAKVPLIVEKWQSMGGGVAGRGGVTHRSIPFWCKASAPDAYNEIRISSFEAQIDLMLSNLTMGNVGSRKSATSGNDVDKANLLVRLAAGRYCCAAIKQRIWYEFRDHRWEELEEGHFLRRMISDDLFDRCHARVLHLHEAYQHALQLDAASDATKMCEKRLEIALNIANSLKETRTIDNVFKETHSRLYEKGFHDKLDANGYLVCFTNGVYDLREHVLRDGQPDDYLSKCAGYAFVPLADQPPERVAKFHAYLASMFPNPETRQYVLNWMMFTFVADAQINQCMHWFTGNGKNGKTKLFDLMRMAHGQRQSYLKGSYYTERTNRMGQASEELYNTINCSFVWSDEFPENGVLVDDQVKVLVSGGEMEARQMYKPPRRFVAKASCAGATNHLLKITGTDEGIWRRTRVCECNVYYTDTPEPGNPYHAKGRSSDEMKALMEEIYTVVVSVAFDMLKTRARANGGSFGVLTPCPEVLRATAAYRMEQDMVAAFIADKTESVASSTVVTHTEVVEVFRRWCMIELGDAGSATRKQAEMVKRMSKMYTHTALNVRPKGWINLRLLHDDAAAGFGGRGGGGGDGDDATVGEKRGRINDEEDDDDVRHHPRRRHGAADADAAAAELDDISL